MDDELIRRILDTMNACLTFYPRIPTGDEKRFLESVEELRALKEIPGHLPSDPRFPEHYNRIPPKERITGILVDAGSYLNELHRETEAIPILERATEIDHDDSDAQRELAIAYGVTGNPSKSLSHFLEVTRLNPEDPVGFIGCGDCLIQLDKIEEALQAFRMAKALAPGHPVVQNRLSRLKSLGIIL